jgi:hypothetical protein
MSIQLARVQPQNFSIPAGFNEIIVFEILETVTTTLDGCTILWNAYPTAFGMRIAGAAAVIAKSTTDGNVMPMTSPLSFQVQLMTEDTQNLLPGNYYQESSIIDPTGQLIGGSFGIMTVTETENLKPASPSP